MTDISGLKLKNSYQDVITKGPDVELEDGDGVDLDRILLKSAQSQKIEIITDGVSAGTGVQKIIASADTGEDAEIALSISNNGVESEIIRLAKNGFVGVKSVDPNRTLTVSGGGGNVKGDIALVNESPGTASSIGSIQFQNATDNIAAIEGLADGASDAGIIKIFTQPTGGNVTERANFPSTGGFTQFELSADPPDPGEGSFVTWMSDGTGSGADGDIMVKITAGGVTKTTTLVDFSAV